MAISGHFTECSHDVLSFFQRKRVRNAWLVRTIALSGTHDSTAPVLPLRQNRCCFGASDGDIFL